MILCPVSAIILKFARKHALTQSRYLLIKAEKEGTDDQVESGASAWLCSSWELKQRGLSKQRSGREELDTWPGRGQGLSPLGASVLPGYGR